MTRAALCRAFGQPLTLETIDLPEPGPSEVRVRLEAVAICHSDISFAEGAWGGDLPALYGHEAVGTVEAAGPGALHGAGARVLVTLIRSCGRCAPCASGAPTACLAPPASGETRAGDERVAVAMHTGAFAEAVVVHESQLVPLPADIPAQAACLLSCGVITGVGAVVNAARLRPGQDVVVIGAGGVGLNAIQGARLAGARRIVAVDLSEAKLEDARAFGATDAVLAEGEPWRAARQATGRGADAVIVTVGAIPAYEAAPRYLAPGGTVVAVGMPHSGATAEWEPVILAAVGQGIRGSKMGDVVLARDVPWMIDLWRQGRLKLDELVSRTFPLEEINAAIADTKGGAARRNVILF